MIILGSIANRFRHREEKAIVVSPNGNYQTSVSTARERNLRPLYEYREDDIAYFVFSDH